MAKHERESFVDIKEAADFLNVKPRTVDRHVAEGLYPKYQLSKRRVGFKLSELDAYLARLNPTTIGSPALESSGKQADYQSPGSGIIEEAPGMTASEAGEFNRLLIKLGFSAVTVLLTRGHMIITWPDSAGYSDDMIAKRVAKAIRKGERVSG